MRIDLTISVVKDTTATLADKWIVHVNGQFTGYVRTSPHTHEYVTQTAREAKADETPCKAGYDFVTAVGSVIDRDFAQLHELKRV